MATAAETLARTRNYPYSDEEEPVATRPAIAPAATPDPSAVAAAGIIERSQPHTAFPAQKQPLVSQRAVQRLTAPVMADSRAVMSGIGDDFSRAVSGGNYGSAVGHVLRGTAALAPAAVADLAGPAWQQLVRPVLGAGAEALGTFLTGEDAQAQPAQASATAPSTSTTVPRPSAAPSLGKPGAAAQALSAPSTGVAGGPDRVNRPTYTAPAGAEVPGVSGVRKIVQGGRTLYTNVDDEADNQQLLAGRGGAVSVLPAAPPRGAGAAATLATSIDPALYAARMAAIQRGDIEAVRSSYGGDFQAGGQPGGATQLLAQQIADEAARGRRMTARGAQIALELTRAQTDARRAADTTSLAATRLAAELPGMRADTRLKDAQGRVAEQLETARAAFTNASTEEEKEAARETLRALQGKYEREYPELFSTQVLQGQVDALGNKTPGTVAVTDKRTGRVRMYDQSGAEITAGAPPQPSAAALPPKDQLKAGTTYQTARGPARWDGRQFVPVQAQ